MGASKIGRYENPYDVKGIIVYAGLKEKPKDKCTDRVVGTWKADN